MSKNWVPDLDYKYKELALTEDSPAFSRSDNRLLLMMPDLAHFQNWRPV